MKAQGANWMVGRKPGETERGIESIDLEARCEVNLRYLKQSCGDKNLGG